MKRIARIQNAYIEKFGIPRQSGLVEAVSSRIIFEPEFRDENAVRGLEEFSHIWILWEFSENVGRKWSPTVRPPRLGGNKRVGVFATRSPFRPNPIGLSCVRLDHIEFGEQGPVLYVDGADLLDGTPIYDIKPYLPHIDSHPEAKGGFTALTREYAVEVEIPEKWMEQIPEQQRQAITGILAQDPRPGYQEDKNRIYGMKYADLEIKFRAEEGKIIVCEVCTERGEK
jgi:tRNA-Thr(GGU) m(6)t(6)A37 methyltransferase TsaA